MIHQGLVGLMRELPRPGAVWAAAGKERFMAALTAMLEVVYPPSAPAQVIEPTAVIRDVANLESSETKHGN